MKDGISETESSQSSHCIGVGEAPRVEEDPALARRCETLMATDRGEIIFLITCAFCFAAAHKEGLDCLFKQLLVVQLERGTAAISGSCARRQATFLKPLTRTFRNKE